MDSVIALLRKKACVIRGVCGVERLSFLTLTKCSGDLSCRIVSKSNHPAANDFIAGPIPPNLTQPNLVRNKGVFHFWKKRREEVKSGLKKRS